MLQTVGRTRRQNFQHRGYATVFLDPFGPAWKSTRMLHWFFDTTTYLPLVADQFYRFCGPIFSPNTVHSLTYLAPDPRSFNSLGTRIDQATLHGTTRVYSTGEVISWELEQRDAADHHFGLTFLLRHNAHRNEVSHSQFSTR